MKKKWIKAGVIAAVAGMLIGSTAYAGTTKEFYASVVGRFNGYGYSRDQTKALTGQDGYINSVIVGGKYKVDVRMENSTAHGAWLRNVTDGTNSPVATHSKLKKGNKVRLKFSNDAFTPVVVEVDGYWKSN